jgi:hypothetical protein
MVASIRIVLVDLLLIGMGGLAICVVAYVFWVMLRDERKYRQERGRESQRRGFWGYE